MLFWTWLLIAILTTGAIVLFHKKVRLPQFGLLALVPAAMLCINVFAPIADSFWNPFWFVWFVALIVCILASPNWGTAAAGIFTILAFVSYLAGPSLLSFQANAPINYELYLQTEDGKTESVDYHANESSPGTSSGNPLIGSQTVNTTFATMTLPGNGSVKSWGDLYNRFDQSSKEVQTDYAAAFNASAHLFGGTFEELRPYLLAAEKAGVDTRVIQVINSDIPDEQARNGVREDVGGATDSMPLVRVNAAVVTTNGGVGAKTVINKWVDGRSAAIPVLTVPDHVTKIKPEQLSANVQAAASSVNIQTPCSNIATGTVEKPKPQPKTPVSPRGPPTGTTTSTPSAPPTTPSTTPPTTTPPTTTPPTTPPPTTPPTTPPPTTTPPTTPPPTTTPPTTPPPTTPPTTPPPTTPTPECTYLPPGNGETPDSPKCLEAKDPSKNHPSPSGKPNAGEPTGAPETTAAVETSPAQPTTQPSSTATQAAPGATTPATPIAVPSSDPVVFPTAGTGIGNPDDTTSVVTSQAKLSAEQEVANQQAAQAVVDQAAAVAAEEAARATANEAAQKAAIEAQVQDEANARAAQAQADAEAAAQKTAAQAAADKAAADAAAKATAEKAAADAAAEKAATALAAQQEADKKATEVANQAAKDKAAEVAKSIATAPAAPAETDQAKSTGLGFVGLPLLFGGMAFRNKKAHATGRKH